MKRTAEDWPYILANRKQRLVTMLTKAGPVPPSLLANDCRLLLQAIYRSHYLWVWQVLRSQIAADFANWRIDRQMRIWNKQGLTEEQIDEEIRRKFEVHDKSAV